MHDYIDHVLANYFSSTSELSEDEATSELRGDLAKSKELKSNLETEVLRALSDPSFSCLRKLEEYDVAFFRDERDAKKYLKKILWDPYFGNELPI